MESYCFSPVAVVESPYREKFAVPRQPGLVAASARIRFLSPFDDPVCVDGLEGCSHIWVQFLFHRTAAAGWQKRVRPPRLGGNRRLGVFATRSNFRPNPLGLSVVQLDSVVASQQGVHLEVSGIDLLDGTPVLDIKPYVPYADAIAQARNDIAPSPPSPRLSVEFSASVERMLKRVDVEGTLRQWIEQLISLDPRPAYRQGEQSGAYGFSLHRYDIRWRMTAPNKAEVIELLLLHD